MNLLRSLFNRYRPDLLIALILFLVPLGFFFQQTVGNKTIVPVDNLYQFEPYASLAEENGVGTPHNSLLSDLILENTAWKEFAIDQIQAGEIPLWQGNIVAGSPFIAAGQSSILYPFSILFLLMPVTKAFGWFAVSQLWLAGLFMYLFARVLGLNRPASLVSALIYQLSGFTLVSVVFPMIIATMCWLPLELAMIELTLRQAPALGGRPATIPWVIVGAIGLGTASLAGHVEALYFTLLVMGFYAGWRILAGWVTNINTPGVFRIVVMRSGWLLILVVVGLALGAVQLLPSAELVQRSFREGAVTLAEVRSWAYPLRRILAFLLPNFYGNPSHHAYVDVFSWTRIPVTVNVAGDAINNTHWGIKNYVEGGAYLGILPVALAMIAVIHWISQSVGTKHAPTNAENPDNSSPIYGGANVGGGFVAGESPGRPYRLIFIVMSLLSLSFVFGSPTYALLYYGLPFINQSHSPFRWVWPLTLAVAVLAGFGMEILSVGTRLALFEGIARYAPTKTESPVDVTNHVPTEGNSSPVHGGGGIGEANVGGGFIQAMGILLLAGGTLTLLGLLATRSMYPRFEGIIQSTFEGLALAPTAFPDGRAFYSYQFWNALQFAIMAVLAGGVLILRNKPFPVGTRLALSEGIARHAPTGSNIKGGSLLFLLAPLVIIIDLTAAMWGFYPAVDPALLDVVPPSITWLKEQQNDNDPWRYIVYEEPGADTFNSNIGWLHGLEEASGYDSLIPGQYAKYMEVIQPQNDLAYNRIAPLYSNHPDALDSPALDLLNVRYVITESEIDSPKYALVYEDNAVRIYENLGALPRAFTLPETSVIISAADNASEGFVAQAQQRDVRGFVILSYHDHPYTNGRAPTDPNNATPAESGPASITVYTANELWIDVQVDEPSWLVVSDSMFPGWRAFIREFEAGDDAEQEISVHLVNGNFRGIRLEPGTWTVRMKYSPDSVRFGGFISFMAFMSLVFVGAVWLWRYAYRESADDSTARRIARNSLTPILLNLFNRGIQFAFAVVSLRILGPIGSGRYQYAVLIFGWFEILSNFGLDTLLIREVSRDKETANRWLFNTTAIRLAIAVIGVPALLGFIRLQAMLAPDNPLARETISAMWLLYVGLFISTINKGLTGLFYVYERVEYPSALQTVATMLNVTLGLIALLIGYGIVGLAGVSIITNSVTLIALTFLVTRNFFKPRIEWDSLLQRNALGESFPLMLNHLLATLFFRIDVILLQALTDDRIVGWYAVVYKWIDAINVIPAFFTQALFPVMSRQAKEDRDALKRNYIFSVKLLSLISLPGAVVTTLLAHLLIGILGGPDFLPYGAIALQIFVWSIPIGWINSVTNYVIIALDRQRTLTWAFVVGTLFNVTANMILIPRYSFKAAAGVTIASEFILLVFFYLVMVKGLGKVNWFTTLWRIVLATAFMAGTATLLDPISTPLALVVSVGVYGAGAFLLKPFNADEREQILSLLPAGIRDWFGGA